MYYLDKIIFVVVVNVAVFVLSVKVYMCIKLTLCSVKINVESVAKLKVYKVAICASNKICDKNLGCESL